MLWNAHEAGLRLVPGQTVGLLGGSFDPPHAGHVHITLEALRRFRLDRVVWLVSPGNPLKAHGPAPLDERMAAARAIMRHPRVIVSDFERLAGTRHTARTLAVLQRAYPGVRFVWLMGADNLAQLHRWEDWRQIMDRMPVGVLARSGSRMAARGSVAAEIYRHARLSARLAPLLARSRPPAWCFLNVPMVDLSSTELRRARQGDA
ncbi:nicotinate-nucleotide adenylyltransferase [Salipiger sp. P9]|uniref:nicotinate-nucleotide adenylyltransferase n=1 Tax=Salipiger pentaromativorans TaxID=2943193 RepID=UPI002157B8D3|nr:nicotinate-nucleotide adenylyltransferase [Salipiger pentaromativorans]MCR8547845.1 nicotinate-nucleotide adenylyltransferase [Salipiger pentaromativorans]